MSIVSYLHHLFNPRNVSILHPYVALERLAPTMSHIPSDLVVTPWSLSQYA